MLWRSLRWVRLASYFKEDLRTMITRRTLAVVGLLMKTSSSLADVNAEGADRRLSLPDGAPGVVVVREDWVLFREQRRPGDTAVHYALSSPPKQDNFSRY